MLVGRQSKQRTAIVHDEHARFEILAGELQGCVGAGALGDVSPRASNSSCPPANLVCYQDIPCVNAQCPTINHNC